MFTTCAVRRLASVRLVLFGVMLVAAAAPVGAQSVTGSIQGTVVDQSGALLPGVTIGITNTATGVTRTVVTDKTGGFRAELLPVGPYDLSAELQGFAAQKQSNINLTVGATLTFRIEMHVASVAETVNVSGVSPVIETTRSQVSDTVGEEAVQNLPVNGRNFISFALLTPGVTTDVRTGDISFAGQRGTLNSLVVDGADNNNTFFGQTLGRTGAGRASYQFSANAVKEFQVNSNAYSAEYGRAGGAVINVVTKSGTNRWSGSVFEFYRDKSLNAIDAINLLRRQPKSPYHFNQFGGSAGGPLRRDKHFFFFNYDGQRNTQANFVFMNVPSTAPSDPDTLAAIAKLTPLAQSWDRTQNQDSFIVKTDHELGSQNRLSVRFNHQDFRGANFENGGPQNSVEHTGASNVKTDTVNASFTSVLASTLFNEVRGQWARDREPGEANSANPEANIRQGPTLVLTIGRNSFSPRETTVKRFQVADTLTWAQAAHKVKTGFDFQFDNIFNFFPGNFFGSYTFNSLASFNIGRPNLLPGEQYVQAFPGSGTTGPETHPDIREYSVFAQDEWRVTEELTANLGLRYDLQKFAKPQVQNPDPQLLASSIDTSRLPTDTTNFGPRLGLAWSPSGQKFVLRGGYGIFYGRTPSILVGTAHSNNGINVQTIVFTGASVPTYPNRFSSIPSGGTARKPSILVVDKDFHNPRVHQASVGFDHEIMSNTTVTVSYLFVKGDNLPRSTDVNFGASSPTSFTVVSTGEQLSYYRFGPGPFVNFQRVISFQSTADSRYNGVTFELNRRFTSHLQFRGAYTLGKVTDTVPDATAVVPGSTGDDLKYASNPANFEADRAAGNNDQRHRFVFSSSCDTNGIADGMSGVGKAIAKGWAFSAIIVAQSGQPYSARVGAVDLNNDGNNRNDLAPGTTRNQFRLPKQVTVDARIARDIPAGRANVQLIVEGFNLLNADNINNVTADLYGVSGALLTRNVNFQQPLGSSGPRILQLALKVTF